MSYGTQSYTQADPGSLSKYLAGKIKSAAQMAAEERKYANDQAEKQRKEGVPEEEIQKHDKGFFFGKSLSHEFGGDLFRRTKGTFSKDPSSTEDPSLSKRERFSNLVRGEVLSPEPFKQLELPLDAGDDKAIPVEDKKLKSWLSVALGGVQKSYDNLAGKLGSLSNKENEQVDNDDKSNKILGKILTNIKGIKSFFDKNNKSKEEELKIEEEQLELQLDSKDNQEMASREASLERGQDLSSVDSYSDPYAEQKDDRGIMDKVKDFITGDDLDLDFSGRRRKRGGRRRGQRRVGSRRRLARRRLGGMSRGIRGGGGRAGLVGGALSMLGNRSPKKLSEGGTVAPAAAAPAASTIINNTSSPEVNNVKNNTQVSNNIKPLTKLSAGGIVDNPTRTILQPGQSVIPLNRNNPVKEMFRSSGPGKNKTPFTQKQREQKDKTGKTLPEQLGKAIQLPAQAAGGLLLSTMSGVFKQLGGVGQMFAPFLTQLFSPIAKVFGLPATVIGSILGGQPAAAATLDAAGMADFLSGGKKKGGKKKGSGGTPPPPPGADLSNTQVKNEVDLATNNHKDVGFTSGFGNRTSPGGVGSTNHRGQDIGTSGQKGYYVALKKTGKVLHNKTMDGGAGNWVGIDVGGGVEYRFMHLANPSPLKVGDSYNGETIGEIGNTGASTGTHLHFEKLVNGAHMDPKSDASSLLSIGKQLESNYTPSSIASPTSGSPSNPAAAQPQRSGTPPSPQRSGTGSSSASSASNIFLPLGGSSSGASSSGSTLTGFTNALTLPTSNAFAPSYPNGLW